MSKASRTKGLFSKLANCRVPSEERLLSLEQRFDGITERHAPTPSRRIKPYITKTQRKELAKLAKQFKGSDDNHPLSRVATLQERGHAMYMGLISSITMKPEQV